MDYQFLIDSYRRKEERGAYILFLFFCIGWCLFSASSSSIRLRGGDGEKDWSMAMGKSERWEQIELGLMAANWVVNNKLVEGDGFKAEIEKIPCYSCDAGCIECNFEFD